MSIVNGYRNDGLGNPERSPEMSLINNISFGNPQGSEQMAVLQGMDLG